MGGSSYGGPELRGADAYVASLPDPGDAGETAGPPARGAEPPLNFTGLIGQGAWRSGRRSEGPPGRGGLWESQSQLCLQWPRGKGSRRMETISPRKPSGSPRAAWRRSGGRGPASPIAGHHPKASEPLRTSPAPPAPRSAARCSNSAHGRLELCTLFPQSLRHPQCFGRSKERLTGRRAALSETGRIPAVRSLSKVPSLEQSCGREGAWRWPRGQALRVEVRRRIRSAAQIQVKDGLGWWER